MTDKNEYIETFLQVWENNLEQHWGFPQGAFRKDGITHVSSDANFAVSTCSGLIIACQDEQLASLIAMAIQKHSATEYSALPTTLQNSFPAHLSTITPRIDISLYCCNPCTTQQTALQDRVELLYPKTEGLPELPDNVEHVFVVREATTVLAWASNIPQLEVSSSWIHSVGVGTHPDYRRQGLGKAVVSALVQHVLSEGGMALWVCDATNIASLNLAHSVGFQDHFWVLHWS